jgi:hypothetical protein
MEIVKSDHCHIITIPLNEIRERYAYIAYTELENKIIEMVPDKYKVIEYIIRETPMGTQICIACEEKTEDEIYLEQLESFIDRLEVSHTINSVSDKRERLTREGRCLHCEQKVKDWEIPSGSFGPEMRATLTKAGIDPYSGHALSCKYKSL